MAKKIVLKTLQIHAGTKKLLDSLKVHKRQSYNDVIVELCYRKAKHK